MNRDRDEKQDMTVRFGGRTLIFDVLVNTDEPIEEVALRIREAAAGPRRRMAVVAARAPLVAPESIPLWRAISRTVDEATGTKREPE